MNRIVQIATSSIKTTDVDEQDSDYSDGYNSNESDKSYNLDECEAYDPASDIMKANRPTNYSNFLRMKGVLIRKMLFYLLQGNNHSLYVKNIMDVLLRWHVIKISILFPILLVVIHVLGKLFFYVLSFVACVFKNNLLYDEISTDLYIFVTILSSKNSSRQIYRRMMGLEVCEKSLCDDVKYTQCKLQLHINRYN